MADDELIMKNGEKVTPEQIKDYFDLIFQAEESGEEYPVDFDLVWPLAYSTKSNAKKALITSDELYEGEDYHIFQNDDVVNRRQGGGTQPDKIFLRVSCLEYFVARKSRPIFEIYRQCRVAMTARSKSLPRYPYHIRRYMMNYPQVPIGYFSILQQMTMQLIAPLEFQGYSLPDKMVPDISEGRIFCKWLREVKGIDPDTFRSYDHHYEDGRVVPARLYPLSLLTDYVTHFQDEWMENRSEKYFKERDPSVVPLLPKLKNPQLNSSPKQIEGGKPDPFSKD